MRICQRSARVYHVEQVTLREVADAVGYHPSYVCRVFKRSVSPSYKLLTKLSAYFECPTDDLVRFFAASNIPGGISGFMRSRRRTALSAR